MEDRMTNEQFYLFLRLFPIDLIELIPDSVFIDFKPDADSIGIISLFSSYNTCFNSFISLNGL